MLKISKAPDAVRVVLREAQGDEPEAFVLFDPITPKMRRRALAVARTELTAAGVEYGDLDPLQLRDVGDLVSAELIRMGVREWGGIGDAAGQLLALTPDQATRIRTAAASDRPKGTIDDLLADEDIFDKLEAGYVLPDAQRRAEKNALSGSPNGISAAATPGNATASLAAKPKRKAAAPNAPTKSTRSKPTTAKGRGKR
jgi:hypothetical protein